MLSLIRHSLYVGVVEKPPPPPLTGKKYGKMEPKYPESGHCQSVLRPHGVLTSPFILNNSVETAAPFNVVSHPPEFTNWHFQKTSPILCRILSLNNDDYN